MAVLALIIINRAGGLIYQRHFRDGLNQVSTNDYLVLAGTFHSVHAMTTRVSPTGSSSGIQTMETAKYQFHCFQTLSGVKFLVVTDIGQFQPDVIINRIYSLYSDYVMKNPFYQMDMPIKCDQFDRHLNSYLMTIA
ncbi:hypothetical protein TRVA0_043S00210 [Trichomonascus vanleenenianus]|uniref:TRAPP subunit TRS23 n=1 Tax=Trichomonascus vanleenenianus TaxID=2268995 RepID=UPI003ECA091D